MKKTTYCAIACATCIGLMAGEPLSEITMDHPGDFIQAPYNTVRNDVSKIMFPTLEQGGGRGVALIKDEVSRNGRFGLKFLLPPFDPKSGDEKDRLETILLRDRGIDETIYESRFSLRIPATTDLVKGWFVIHQWHQSSPESPPIAICLDEGHKSRLLVQVRHGPRKKGTRTEQLRRVDSGEDYIDLTLDEWSDWKIHWRLSTTEPSKGLLDIYMDSVLVFTYRGLLGFSQVRDQTVSEKFGIYREKDSEGTHQIYYDSLSVTAMPTEFVPSPTTNAASPER